MLKEIAVSGNGVEAHSNNHNGRLWRDAASFDYGRSRGFERLVQLKPFDKALVGTVQKWVNSGWGFNQVRIKDEGFKKVLIAIFENSSKKNGVQNLGEALRPDLQEFIVKHNGKILMI